MIIVIERIKNSTIVNTNRFTTAFILTKYYQAIRSYCCVQNLIDKTCKMVSKVI